MDVYVERKDKIDILQIIDKKLETEMHFHNAGFHNRTPPTTEKSCVGARRISRYSVSIVLMI